MPRRNNGLEVFSRLVSIEKFTLVPSGTPGDTVTTAPIAAGAGTAALTAQTNFSLNDPVFIIGSGGFELNAIKGPLAASMPLAYKTAFAHAVGARVVEARRIDLGHLDESGVTFGGSVQLNPVNASTSKVPIAYIAGAGDLTASFNLRGYNNLNLQTIFGIDEEEAGTGTADDPYQVGLSGESIGTHGLQAYRVRGVLTDGVTNVIVDFCGAQVQVNANVALGGQGGAALGVSIKYSNLIQRIW